MTVKIIMFTAYRQITGRGDPGAGCPKYTLLQSLVGSILRCFSLLELHVVHKALTSSLAIVVILGTWLY